MAAVLKAGRGRLAVGWYHSLDGVWQSNKKTEVLTPDELVERILESTLVCGEITQEERQLFKEKQKIIRLSTPAHSLRRPAFLAELAWERWQRGLLDDPATLSPTYLHHKDPIPG